MRKYLTLESPPVHALRPPCRTKISPYLAYLEKRWNEGAHNGRKLYLEIIQMGYRGSDKRVYAAIHPWRQTQPGLPTPQAPRLNRLVLRRPDKLEDTEKEELKMILEANPRLALGYNLREEFYNIIRQKDIAGLDGWLKQAGTSGIIPFQKLAKSLSRDYQAVKLSLATPWSTAQCEGQICRVKLIKRSGYGRAKIDLLRQRVLHRISLTR